MTMPQTYSDGLATRPRFYEVEVRTKGLPIWGLVFALSAETAAYQLAMDKGYGAVWDVNEGWWARRSDNEWFGNLPIPESEDYEVWSTEETYRRVEAPTPALAAGLILESGAQLHRRLWTAFRIRDGARFSPAGGGGAEMQNDQPLPYTDYQWQRQEYRVELAGGAYYIWAHGAATAAEFASPSSFDAANDDWRAVRLCDGRLFGNGAAPQVASSDEDDDLYEVHGETRPGGPLRWSLVRAKSPEQAATEALGPTHGSWWWARTSTDWFGMLTKDEDYIVQSPLIRAPKVIEASSPAFAAKTALRLSMKELPRLSWNALRVRDGRLFGTDPNTTVERFSYERPYTDEAPVLGASREYVVHFAGHFGGDEFVQQNGPNAEDAAYKAAATRRGPTWDPWSEFWTARRISDGRRFGHGWQGPKPQERPSDGTQIEWRLASGKGAPVTRSPTPPFRPVKVERNSYKSDKAIMRRYDVELRVAGGSVRRSAVEAPTAVMAAVDTAWWAGIEAFDAKGHAWLAKRLEDGHWFGTVGVHGEAT